MRIVEKDGNKFVVFEDGVDDELRDSFYREQDKMRVLQDEACKAFDELKAAQRKVELIIRKVDLYKLENHDQIWGPVDEEVKKVLGVDEAPNLSFNFERRELTIKEPEKGGGGTGPEALISLLGALAGGPKAIAIPVPVKASDADEEDDDLDGETIH